jgi:hypothetical protein
MSFREEAHRHLGDPVAHLHAKEIALSIETKVVSAFLAALLALDDGAFEALHTHRATEPLQGLSIALRKAVTIIS